VEARRREETDKKLVPKKGESDDARKTSETIRSKIKPEGYQMDKKGRGPGQNEKQQLS